MSLESSQRPDGTTGGLLERLAEQGTKSTRYELEGEIARGGMGAILKIWDAGLRRHLAMKVVLGEGAERNARIDPRVLTRFLEEAQVTGQLDHPGIVPVHELGLDADGRVYFTMKLVQGRDLEEIFRLVFAGEEGWNETRALGVILKACEAIAYAHKKGVIHRDLKPANVMVGSFGEVYVMDWGVARVLGREDAHDLRIAPETPRVGRTPATVSTVRSEERKTEPHSALHTMDGDVMGTPAYMPPEQARGEIEKLSACSDVYSIGAMLYHLLARHVPYDRTGPPRSGLEVVRAVREGAPTPLRELRRDVPPELEAITEKAMARDPAQRYADTLELAEDLRAFLEGRVVQAYRTGAFVELRKWVQRNKPLAAAVAGAILILIAGILVSTAKTREAEAARLETAAKNVELGAATEAAQASEARAVAQERLATQKSDDVLSLSAIQDLKELEERADRLWPADPERLPAYATWLEDARILIEGQPADAARGRKKRPSLAEHEAQLARIRERAKSSSRAGTFEFEDGEDRWWHEQLAKLVAELKAFQDERTGGLYSAGTSEAHGWGIVKRADFARTLRDRSVDSAAARKRWDEAIAAIAASPRYGGLALAPQLGLVPIGPDPDSGLWEFSHLATAEGYAPAERGDDGRIVLEDGIGLVLVLIPGGTFWMGAQSVDPAERNYDPQALAIEMPVHAVTLSPYFLSKYEMTQAQWSRIASRNPSQYTATNFDGIWSRDGAGSLELHPVERVSWTRCVEVLLQLGLALPTEAQWENAARGGTDTPYWTGSDVASLEGAANVADAYAKPHGGDSLRVWEQELDDGNTVHARIGSYPANPLGLHEVTGNVWEWCADGYDEIFYRRSPSLDPVAPHDGLQSRIFRGGGFFFAASFGRSANRFNSTPEFQSHDLGVRPARAVQRR